MNGALLYAQQGRSAAFAQQYQWYLNHWPNNRASFPAGAFFSSAYGPGLWRAVVHRHGVPGPSQFCPGRRVHICVSGPRAFGAKASLAFLPLYALFAPVYFQSSVAYTDTLFIWAAPATLFLWQLGRDAGRLRTRLAAWAGCAVCLGVGYEIKGICGHCAGGTVL